jgi:hypothetical protein
VKEKSSPPLLKAPGKKTAAKKKGKMTGKPASTSDSKKRKRITVASDSER